MPDKLKIESLGVYLPDHVLTMEELLRSCRRRPRWDLERITGIHERRVAVGEYAADLAVKAAERALAMSRYQAARPRRRSSAPASPSTTAPTSSASSRRPRSLVRKALGAERALVFDVVNACAGMLNGIWVLQGLIRGRRGPLRDGGERRAEHAARPRPPTREMRHSFDGQLAALTLGDCGAAVILDASTDPRVGFHWLDLVTGAKHDHYCYSQPSRRGRGGILITKARGLQRKGDRALPLLLQAGARRARGWSLDDVHHVIPHQVSVRAIAATGSRPWRRFLGSRAPRPLPAAAPRSTATPPPPATSSPSTSSCCEGTIEPGTERAAGERRLGDRHLPRHLHLRRPAGALPGRGSGRRRGMSAAAASRAWG